MKTKLHKAGFLAVLMLLGAQTYAQTGGALNRATVTGVFAEAGAPYEIYDGVVLELEDFDLGNNENAAPTGTVGAPNPGVAPFGYFNKDLGNQGDWSNMYRPDTDVDLSYVDEGSGVERVFLPGQPAGEHLYYTISVAAEFPADEGAYKAFITYKSFGANKSIELKRYSTDLVLAEDLYATTALPSTNMAPEGFIYREFETDPFNLVAGTWVLRVKFSSGTPDFDKIRFVYQGPLLGVADAQLKANTLKIYPNPANDGHFNLSIDSKWDVYSLLGVKVLEGEGKSVDLSIVAKGAYILKTPYTSKMLISK